ncbi:MAG: hypothetical protein JNJ94_00080 [Chlorobi bacterium]|nr:hypothetical protein [Chlorobiota bacterium]
MTDPTQYPIHVPENPNLPPVMNLRDYLAVLLRYRSLLLTIILTGLVLVIVYSFIMPKTFTAGAVLLPPEKSEGMSLNNLILGGGSGFDLKSLGQNSSAEVFVKILTSRSLADSLVTRLNLLQRYDVDSAQRSLAIEQVMGRIEAESDKQGVISVTYNEKTSFLSDKAEQQEVATFTATLINNAIEILDKLNQQKSVTRARRSRIFLEKMKEEKRKEMDSAQRAMQAFQEQNKAIALDKQLDAALSSVIETQAMIQKAKLELIRAESDLNSDQRTVQSLRSQLALLQRQQQNVETGNSGVDALGIPFKNVPELARQYATLKLNLEVTTQVYMLLEAQYNQEKIQEARELPTVSVLDWATTPLYPSAPRKTIIVAVTGILLTAFSVLGVYLYDGLQRGIYSNKQQAMNHKQIDPGSNK